MTAVTRMVTQKLFNVGPSSIQRCVASAPTPAGVSLCRIPHPHVTARARSSWLAVRRQQQLQQHHGDLWGVIHQQRRFHSSRSPLQVAAAAKQEQPCSKQAPGLSPTILTVGWLGAKEKPFSKYTQLWQALGYPNVTSVRPPLAAIVLPALGRQQAAQLAAIWLQQQQQRQQQQQQQGSQLLHPLGAALQGQQAEAQRGQQQQQQIPIASCSTTTTAAAEAGGDGGSPMQQVLQGSGNGHGQVVAATPTEQQQQQQHTGGGNTSHSSTSQGSTGGRVEGEQQVQDPGVIIHLFSGGGYIFTAWLMQQLVAQGAEQQLHRIKGIIFDSSPAQVIPDVAARALVAAVLGEAAEKVEQRHPYLVGGVSAGVGAYLQLPPIHRCLAEVHATWEQLAPPCPMLFLHSASDVLVPPEVVQQFMKRQAARGAAVRDKLWLDSPHVDHWRSYTAEYEEQLQLFASQVLGGTEGDLQGEGADWRIPAGRQTAS